MRKFLLILLALAALGLALLVVLSQRPGPVGLVEGALRPCAGSACLNSQIGPPETRVQPLFVQSSGGPTVGEAWRALQWLIAEEGHGTLRRVADPWMHAEWRPSILPIPVDVEFLRLDASGVIHVRSAGRLGSFGFDKHVTALEQLRAQLAETMRVGLPQAPSDPSVGGPAAPAAGD